MCCTVGYSVGLPCYLTTYYKIFYSNTFTCTRFSLQSDICGQNPEDWSRQHCQPLSHPHQSYMWSEFRGLEQKALSTPPPTTPEWHVVRIPRLGAESTVNTPPTKPQSEMWSESRGLEQTALSTPPPSTPELHVIRIPRFGAESTVNTPPTKRQSEMWSEFPSFNR